MHGKIGGKVIDDPFIKIISFSQIEVIGLKTELTSSQNRNFDIISKHWKAFNSALYTIPNHSKPSGNWVKYGITYKENGTYYYLASIPNNPDSICPGNMIRQTITLGNYALFCHKGKMSDIKRTVSYIFKEAVPARNIAIKEIDSSGIVYFEKYDEKFKWNRGDSIIELFLPILE